MKLNTTIIFALALDLVLVFFRGELKPSNARELLLKGVSISSASDEELEKAGEASIPIIPPLNCSGSSLRPTASLGLTCDPRSLGINQYEGGAIGCFNS